MKAYLIADITIRDVNRFMDYVAAVPAFIAKHGGHYVVRGGEPVPHEGNWAPQRMVVIEFPDREHAEAFLADPEYAPVAAIRHESADSNVVIVEGHTGN